MTVRQLVPATALVLCLAAGSVLPAGAAPVEPEWAIAFVKEKGACMIAPVSGRSADRSASFTISPKESHVTIGWFVEPTTEKLTVNGQEKAGGDKLTRVTGEYRFHWDLQDPRAFVGDILAKKRIEVGLPNGMVPISMSSFAAKAADIQSCMEQALNPAGPAAEAPAAAGVAAAPKG